MKQHLDSRPMPFPNLTAALRHWAVTTPDSLALAAGDSELTYAELSERVDRCAAWLTEQGVQAGERVVVVGHNSIPWVVHYLAVLSLEAVIAPANNRLNPAQFADQVELLDAALVLADEDHSPIVADVEASRVRSLGDENHATVHSTPPLPAAEAPALISFTSGTTGRPKGATLTQNALAAASWAFVRVLRTSGDDSTLVVVPMFHNTGFIDQFGHMLLLGGRTDLLRKFRTKAAIEALTARPVTYLAAVPSIIRLLMLAPGAPKAFASIRTLLYGGSPMPAPWIDELLGKWPQLQLFHGYGLTEYGSAISFLPPEYARDHGVSVGFPVPGTAVRIIGENYVDVEPGEVGELWCTGDTMMQGYWRQPELTQAKIHDGWLRTGDLARFEDGFYFIEGRVDDVINRGGEKVLPSHVEAVLSTLESVGQSCVFPVPDPILQSRVWAAVEERPGSAFDEASARDALLRLLPDYAVPERIEVVSPLPRTASGKVDRRALTIQFAQNA